MSLSRRYRVWLQVRGELGQAWSAVFDDLVIEPEPGGTTLIKGHIRDQEALHGLLAAVRDLGLPLVSLVAFAAPDSPPPAQP